MTPLLAYLRTHRNARFRYGTHDCALFAARWVLVRTGRDLTLGIKYTSLRDGREKLAAAGFASHIEIAARDLAEIPPAMAQPGDIAVIDGSLGIVTGERIAVLGRSGCGHRPLTDATRAFRV